MHTKDLNIPGTQSSPHVQADWDGGVLCMSGDSYPENSFELFEPMLNWLTDYVEHSQEPLRLELSLRYLNTSSVKVMMDVFDLLEVAYKTGRRIELIWFYDTRNHRVAELAGEFKEDCSFPFDIHPKIF